MWVYGEYYRGIWKPKKTNMEELRMVRDSRTVTVVAAIVRRTQNGKGHVTGGNMLLREIMEGRIFG